MPKCLTSRETHLRGPPSYKRHLKDVCAECRINNTRRKRPVKQHGNCFKHEDQWPPISGRLKVKAETVETSN